MQNKFKLHPCCIPVSGINQNNEQILVKRKQTDEGLIRL